MKTRAKKMKKKKRQTVEMASLCCLNSKTIKDNSIKMTNNTIIKKLTTQWLPKFLAPKWPIWKCPFSINSSQYPT